MCTRACLSGTVPYTHNALYRDADPVAMGIAKLSKACYKMNPRTGVPQTANKNALSVTLFEVTKELPIAPDSGSL